MKAHKRPVTTKEILRALDRTIQALIESEQVGGIVPPGPVTREIQVLTCARNTLSECAWISVREQMPDADLCVLIYNTDPAFSEPVWIGYHDGESWVAASGERLSHVTHWMNFPEPPSFAPSRLRVSRNAK